MIRVIALLLFVLPGVVLAQNPNPPIYGERDAKTGSVRLNRDWAEPVRAMLRRAVAIEAKDTDSNQSVRFELRGIGPEPAMRLLGPIVAITTTGTVKRQDVQNGSGILVETDMQGVEVAKTLLPLAIDALSNPPIEPTRLSLIKQLQGRWIMDVVQPAEHAWKGNVRVEINDDQITFYTDAPAKTQVRKMEIDEDSDPPRIQFTNVEDGETQTKKALLWVHSKRGSPAHGFGIVMTNDGPEYPKDINMGPGVIRVSYKRDEKDPAWLRNEARNLSQIAVANLLSDQVSVYRTARRFLDRSMSFEVEADLRQQAADVLAMADQQQEEGKTRDAKESQQNGELLHLRADEEQAIRLAHMRIEQDSDRTRAKADQLTLQRESLLSEGRMKEAAEVEHELNAILRSVDPDNFKVRDLERRVVAARLEGNHQLADQLKQQAGELRLELNSRYAGLAILPSGMGGGLLAPRAASTTGSDKLPIVLRHVPADEAIAVLEELDMIGEQLRVTSPRPNLLILIGHENAFAEPQRIVQAIDVASATPGPSAAVEPLSDNSPVASGPPAIIARAFQQETEEIRARLAESQENYGPKHPLSRQLAKQLSELDAEIAALDAEWNLQWNELERLVETRGADHPEVQDKLAMYAARHRLDGEPKPPEHTIVWDAVIARQRARYEQAERDAAALAVEFSKVTGDSSADEGKRLKLRFQIKSRVNAAFAYRMVLQLIQLEKAHHDLQLAQQRLRRRDALAGKIVERRVEELISGEDLSWLPAEKEHEQSSAVESGSPRPDFPDQAAQQAIPQETITAMDKAVSAEVINLMQEAYESLNEKIADAERELKVNADDNEKEKQTLETTIARLKADLSLTEKQQRDLKSQETQLSSLLKSNELKGDALDKVMAEVKSVADQQADYNEQRSITATAIRDHEKRLADIDKAMERLEGKRSEIQRNQLLRKKLLERMKAIAPDLDIDLSDSDLSEKSTDQAAISVNFIDTPYTDVFSWLARTASMKVSVESPPQGTLSLTSVDAMTLAELIDLLNEDLARKGLIAKIEEDLISVRPIDQSLLVPRVAAPLEPAKEGAVRVMNVSRITSPEMKAVCSVVVSPDGRHLYAAARDSEKLFVFGRKADRDGPHTELIQIVESENDLDGVVGLRVTPDGKYVVATSFRGRTVTLFARDQENGLLTRKDAVRDNENGITGLHWAFDCEVSPDSRYVYVTNSTTVRNASDLPSIGTGHVTSFEIVDDKLRLLEVHTGRNDCFDGAAHIAIHPSGKWLYVANYRSHAVAVIARDVHNGQMRLQQIVRDNDLLTLEGVFSVRCSPDGRQLYASSGRFGGESGVTAFRIHDEDETVTGMVPGSLTPLQVHRGGDEGKLARFSGGNRVLVSPDGNAVYVAGSLSGNLVSFSRDPETGRLHDPEIIRLTPEDEQLGPASIGLTPDGRFLYAAAQDHQSVLILKTGKPAETR